MRKNSPGRQVRPRATLTLKTRFEFASAATSQFSAYFALSAAYVLT
jgi:hypothetical protein